MTTLNAMANNAYRAEVEAYEKESGNEWPGFDDEMEGYEAGWAAGYKAAVHEAYVNAQRAVSTIEWGGGTINWQAGRRTMQEDAVRAIREAAEENR